MVVHREKTAIDVNLNWACTGNNLEWKFYIWFWKNLNLVFGPIFLSEISLFWREFSSQLMGAEHLKSSGNIILYQGSSQMSSGLWKLSSELLFFLLLFVSSKCLVLWVGLSHSVWERLKIYEQLWKSYGPQCSWIGGRPHWMFLLLCSCSCASSFRRPQMRESVYKSPGCAVN